MPYFPPAPRAVSMLLENLGEGNLTLSDDGYWGVSEAYIDSISVSTISTNWDLYLCIDSSFNISDVRTRKLVSNGLGDAIVPVDETYQSTDGKVYLVFNDLAGSSIASFYIVGRTI